jgi:hypothetical protein
LLDFHLYFLLSEARFFDISETGEVGDGVWGEGGEGTVRMVKGSENGEGK